jgi:hypothetical protein
LHNQKKCSTFAAQKWNLYNIPAAMQRKNVRRLLTENGIVEYGNVKSAINLKRQ